jgi:hypothetical protein
MGYGLRATCVHREGGVTDTGQPADRGQAQHRTEDLWIEVQERRPLAALAGESGDIPAERHW